MPPFDYDATPDENPLLAALRARGVTPAGFGGPGVAGPGYYIPGSPGMGDLTDLATQVGPADLAASSSRADARMPQARNKAPEGARPGPPPGQAFGGLGTGTPFYRNDQERGQMMPWDFASRLTPGTRPEDISLADMQRYLREGTATQVGGAGWGESQQDRLQGLQALFGQAQQAGALRTQAADVGLRAAQQFGVPAGMLQGQAGGQLGNDAARLQMDRERHADALSRQTRIDQATQQFALTNPQSSPQDLARFRQGLERNIPASNPMVDALRAGPAGAYGPAPGAPGAYQGGPAGRPPYTEVDPNGRPVPRGGPRADQGPPAAQPWDAIGDRLDNEWSRILQTYGQQQGQGPGGQRQIAPDRAGDAIADLVTSLGPEFVQQNIQALHPYLINRFGGPAMDTWFTARQSRMAGNAPQSRARQTLMDALNSRGANIGMGAVNQQSPWWTNFGAQNAGTQLGNVLRSINPF